MLPQEHLFEGTLKSFVGESYVIIAFAVKSSAEGQQNVSSQGLIGYDIQQPLITRFMGPSWGPPGSCRPQVGPCRPHEPCYLGHYCFHLLLKHHVHFLTLVICKSYDSYWIILFLIGPDRIITNGHPVSGPVCEQSGYSYWFSQWNITVVVRGLEGNCEILSLRALFSLFLYLWPSLWRNILYF